MEIKGQISGTGNSATRQNEITADDLATLRHFIVGLESGVVDKTGYNFSEISHNATSIKLGKGIMFAYGYFGYVDSSTFYFVKPAVTQYHYIYVELDKSVIPNTCILKVKNNQSSKNIENAFRQDVLSLVKTGIYQLPLYMVELNSNGINNVEDIRSLRQSIKKVFKANITKGITGTIASNVTAPTGAINQYGKSPATTHFVDINIQEEINR